MIGETFGNYEVLATLGKGGMGEVFLAQHQRIARRAAIKVLAPELTKDPDVVRRFFNEARATSLIQHPGIVDVFDCDVDARGRAYIVMEYLKGETLAARLGRTGSLSCGIACAIGRQIADAVGAAHGSGIIHRDLKPENVLLCADDARAPGAGIAVKVLDFGIAKLLSSEAGGDSDRLTRTGMLLGTPRYISPEQCYGAAGVDQRTDIYSLGCILYEMICGVPPFAAEGLQAVMAAHMFLPAPAASELVPAIPAWLDQLLLRMLAKTPDERPASMVEVATSLAAGEDRADTGEEHVAPLAAAPISTRSWRAAPPFTKLYPEETTSQHRRRRRVILRKAGLAIAAGGIAAVLVAIWSSTGADPSSDSAESPDPRAVAVDVGASTSVASARAVAGVGGRLEALDHPPPIAPQPSQEVAGVLQIVAPTAPAVVPSSPIRRRAGPLAPARSPGRLHAITPKGADGIVDL